MNETTREVVLGAPPIGRREGVVEHQLDVVLAVRHLHVDPASGTGGAAVAAVVDFLSDDRSMADLAARVGAKKGGEFPPFEALLKIEKGVVLPRNTSIVTCRALPMTGSSSPLAQNASQSYSKN